MWCGIAAGSEEWMLLLYKHVFSAFVRVATVHKAAASVPWWKHCMTWFFHHCSCTTVNVQLSIKKLPLSFNPSV